MSERQILAGVGGALESHGPKAPEEPGRKHAIALEAHGGYIQLPGYPKCLATQNALLPKMPSCWITVQFG